MTKSNFIRRRLTTALAAVLLLAIATGPAGVTAGTPGDSFGRNGLEGSGVATMTTQAVPARIGRVARVPGSTEVWGIGLTTAPLPGYDSADPAGQIVFLRYTPESGWRDMGPPQRANGDNFNPTLFALAIAAGGEGWAVGESGLMLRKAAGSTHWVEAPAAAAQGEDLHSVSLLRESGRVYGVAGGTSAKILRYNGAGWSSESGTDVTADGSPDLADVSIASSTVAWAVSSSSTTALRVYRRAANGAWSRVAVDSSPQYPIFGGPQPSQGPNGGINQAAYGAAIVADAKGAWVGGAMLPGEAVHPTGDPTAGDATRPFVIRLSNDGSAPASYCPRQYSLRKRSGDVEVNQTALCSHPFPISAFGVASLEIVGSDVFAGGLGLFHYTGSTWSREPNAIGFIISMAFASRTDGWMATTGNTYGTGGAVHSSENLVGRWSNHAQPVRLARFPQPNLSTLSGVAISPDDDGRALAAGADGQVVSYLPGAGWDVEDRQTNDNLLDVAWPASNRAFAVGAHGVVVEWRDGRWSSLPQPARATSNTLFAVAFRSPTDGVAVGAAGTILRFDGFRWRQDASSGRLTDADLYDVEYGRSGLVAVGEDATVIENRGHGWKVQRDAASLLSGSPSGPPALYAVVERPDGTIVAGGQRSALIQRKPGGTFTAFAPAVEGTILALATAARPQLVASVSPDTRKFNGDAFVATRAALVALDKGSWRDLGLGRRRTPYITTDAAAFSDPVYALAVDGDGTGWAVGGFPADVRDAEDRLRFGSTSSVYRFDLDNDPTPFDPVGTPVLPSHGVNFAFFAETWCSKGLCSLTMGSGSQADLVASQIRDEIGRAAKLPNAPSFVMFGGSGRAAGIPEELEQQAAFLKSLALPTYGTLGSTDLFGETDGTSVKQAAGQNGETVARGSDFWQRAFFDGFPKPWGGRKQPAGIAPVLGCNGCSVPVPNLASTHYAFDVTESSRKLVRFIVMDSSSKSYGDPLVADDQNPRGEYQRDWLTSVVTDAKTQNNLRGVPIIVVMNQPTIVPDRTPQVNWSNPGDATDFQTAATANAFSAVVTGGLRMAMQDGYPNADNPTVPVFILGTGGAPLGYDPPNPSTAPASKLPTDGFYNAWYVVNVDPDTPRVPGLPGQVAVKVIPMPVLDSIALHAPQGRRVAAGNTLTFSALARSLSGGTSDPEQSNAGYFWIGNDTLTTCGSPGLGNGLCQARDALKPPYKFWTDDPTVADFVSPDLGRRNGFPEIINGKPRHDADGLNGFLCTYKAGDTTIHVSSGFKQASMKIHIDGGFGPCVDKPVIVNPTPTPTPTIFPTIIKKIPRPHFFFYRNTPQDLVVVPPPPAPVVVPAPPGAPGVGRKEEHEVETEKQGHGENEFTALRHRSRYDPASQPYAFIAMIAGIALAGAFGASALGRRRGDPIVQEAREQ